MPVKEQKMESSFQIQKNIIFFSGEKDFKDIYDPDPFDGDTSQKTKHFKDYCGNTTGGEVSSANDG